MVARVCGHCVLVFGDAGDVATGPRAQLGFRVEGIFVTSQARAMEARWSTKTQPDTRADGPEEQHAGCIRAIAITRVSSVFGGYIYDLLHRRSQDAFGMHTDSGTWTPLKTHTSSHQTALP
eukprot:m.1301448 g.1301448  ORF g.1301448 m.1301448 type:complete len:121 (+) comp24805_c0_seq17:3055-3417(+)